MRLLKRTVAIVLSIAMLALLYIPSFAQETSAGSLFAIESIDIKGDKLTAVTVASADCTLVVAFYDEQADTLLCAASGAVRLTDARFAEKTEVEIDCSSLDLPEFFVVKAYLLDSNLQSLCAPYSTMRFTEGFFALREKNALDYTGQPHLVFSADGESFAAINRNAVVLSNNGNTNILTSPENASGSYVFSTISNEMKALTAGDILFYEYGVKPEEFLLIKVASIEFNTDSSCIVYAAPAALSELFECIKIDIDLVPEIDTSASLENGVTYVGVTKDGSFGYDIDSRWLTSEVEGIADIKCGAHFSMYYYGGMLGEDYYEVSFSAQLNTKTDIQLSKKLEKTLKLLPIKLASPIPGIVAKVIPELYISSDSGCGISLSQSSQIGTAYSSLFGCSDAVDLPVAELSAIDCGNDANIIFGLSADYTLSALKNCIIEATACAKNSLNAVYSQKGENHSCEKCMAVNTYGSLSGETKIAVGRRMTGGSIYNKSDISGISLGEYYNSTENGFGKGGCPSALPTVGTVRPIEPSAHSYDGEKALNEYAASSGAISFNRCSPDSDYTLILVKDAKSKQLLSSDNIVYIGLARSDEEGMLSFNYKSSVNADTCNVLLCGDANGKSDCAHIPGKWTSAVVPPCTLVGIDAVYCVKCGETLSERTVPPVAHNWDEWIIISQADLEKEGEKKHTCLRCGKTETVKIDKLVKKVYPMGDANGDFVVTSEDARLVLRHAVNLEELTGVAFSCADVDANREVSSADARLVLRISVKLEDYSDKNITVIE